ncbi:hypothetical protein PIIN_01664 [Serendipita indica DSM 11827]|uniref:Uncharacterized protein n=1 Tax=Serendipita indica (strain DSM 11827) TaxID=1109443 RepID=G4T947_SERID|nr:hypothetical protein PIIN_01664 [Serendipita indica DSM 11827]
MHPQRLVPQRAFFLSNIQNQKNQARTLHREWSAPADSAFSIAGSSSLMMNAQSRIFFIRWYSIWFSDSPRPSFATVKTQYLIPYRRVGTIFTLAPAFHS